MSWDIRAFMPNRISGQIAIIIAASLIVIHVVITAAFFLSRPEHWPDRPPDQIVTLVELIDATSPGLRPRLVADMAKVFPHLNVALSEAIQGFGDRDSDDRFLDGIRRRLGPGYGVTRGVGGAQSNDATASLVTVRLQDGQVVTARIPLMPPPLFGPAVITLLFIATSVTLLGLWAARGLTRPLRSFARAAENFSPQGAIVWLPERGPYEIRTAARALNQMRERIKNLVDERTRMLVAVSHDLRTPITRLRLRCEFIENHALRTPALDDLNHMNSMIENVLNFLRDGRSNNRPIAIDLATSLQTICDQFADIGHEIAYDGPDHVVVSACHDDLQRAVVNLVDNAVRYGGSTIVRLVEEPFDVTVAIEDSGPGIAESEKELMFRPFARGDAARSMNEGSGFGLGLSIAQTTIEAHGGTLELVDRLPSGLIARIRLPRVRADAAA
jgi:signal transduction histidine kinase